MSSTIFFAGILIILGHAFKVLFDKTRIPDVLPLVLLGIIAGPLTGLVTPENFGIMGNLLGTLALSIILFYSGLEIDIDTATKSLFAGTKLSLFNFISATLLCAAAAYIAAPMTYMEALAIGAMLGGTSFAIVIPLVRSMKTQDGTKTILLLESTFTDVLCIVVTLGIFQMIRLREMNPGFMIGQILASFTMSSAIGIISAVFWATALHRVRKLENDMLLTPAFIITIFGLTEFLGYSGAISSLAFGMTSGNLRRFISAPMLKKMVPQNIMEFNQMEISLFSELVFVLKTFFFFYIGISIKMSDPRMVVIGALLTLLILLARMAAVRFCFNGSVAATDKAVISAMGPKGLVSAVLLSMAAAAGFSEIQLVSELVYSTILFSIILAALLSYLIEKGKLNRIIMRAFPAPEKMEEEHEQTGSRTV